MGKHCIHASACEREIEREREMVGNTETRIQAPYHL